MSVAVPYVQHVEVVLASVCLLVPFDRLKARVTRGRARFAHTTLLVLTMLLALAPRAYAHKPSDSYLQLTPAEGGLTGEWRIALRDLEAAVGLDRDGDRRITWGEVRARHSAIAAYALSRLTISAGSPCSMRAGTQLVDDLSDGAYTVLPIQVSCEGNTTAWTLGYSLLFDIDPTHRGLVTLRGQGDTQTFVLSPQQNEIALSVGSPKRWRRFIDMVREGVWHIWIGFDHILFLLALLLPAGLRADQTSPLMPAPIGGTGMPVVISQVRTTRPSRGRMLEDVLLLVTAFTIAHSITLSLAALEIISLPTRLIETAIALSVVVAGVRLHYAISRPAIWVAFAFGLIHGFGFANVLGDLQLPTDALALSLFAFNVGVELGQCAIVLVTLPVIRYAQGHLFYRRAFLPVAAVLIAAIGVAWSLERGAGISLP